MKLRQSQQKCIINEACKAPVVVVVVVVVVRLTVALCTAPTMVINARAMERHLWMAQDAATDM